MAVSGGSCYMPLAERRRAAVRTAAVVVGRRAERAEEVVRTEPGVRRKAKEPRMARVLAAARRAGHTGTEEVGLRTAVERPLSHIDSAEEAGGSSRLGAVVEEDRDWPVEEEGADPAEVGSSLGGSVALN